MPRKTVSRHPNLIGDHLAGPIRACLLAVAVGVALLAPSPGLADAAVPSVSPAGSRAPAVDPSASGGAGITATEAQALELMLSVVPLRYASADPTHTLAPAAVSRALAAEARTRVLASQAFLHARSPALTKQLLQTLGALTGELQATRERFQPWPLTLEVKALSARAERVLDGLLGPPQPLAHRPAPESLNPSAPTTPPDPPKPPARPYHAIETALAEVERDAAAGRTQAAQFQALRAFALYAAGPGARLELQDPALDAELVHTLLLGSGGAPALVEQLGAGASAAAVKRASAGVRADVNHVAEALAEVQVSHATIVIDAAIIVFREGLEAVLILAAITASFVGAKRHLRRPVFLGALAGLLATALTWVIAQLLLHLLSEGGLELQAVTGLIAIGVLLLVTNWFFHRVYWSEWISRFNRRRKALERFDRLGFVSGQALGFVLLGLSSVYREGLETVLFLQALQTSAGTSTTLLGAGIGLGGTLIVGTATFKLQRKLPFKRMLIVTGVLIALVLAVMVGTTIHNLQAIGWVATTPTSFHVPLSWNIWLGVYATWEGIAAQLGALVFVLGSYFAARELQVRRPQRRARRTVAPAAAPELWSGAQ